ncbi:hypothetical protein GCM10009558_023800 [Virgisporangium aurantiacum]
MAEIRDAVGVVTPQAVVDPLPDERSAEPFVALQDPLVVGQRTGAVAHGVAVLAQQVRQGAAPDVVGRTGRDAVGCRLFAEADLRELRQ